MLAYLFDFKSIFVNFVQPSENEIPTLSDRAVLCEELVSKALQNDHSFLNSCVQFSEL